MKLNKYHLRKLILESISQKEIKMAEIERAVKKCLQKEGGAAGLKLLIKSVKDLETKSKKLPKNCSTNDKIKKCIMKMDFVVKHRYDDIILTTGLPKKINEIAEGEQCPMATVDKDLNDKNKEEAALNKDIKYGYPVEVPELRALAAEDKMCGNCKAFDISDKMVECDGASMDGVRGYCHMHDFSCHAEKTCLTWASGGPKTN